jgi:hypothetical protein
VNAAALLVGAALLFWAQQTGLWFAAVPMAVGLEGALLLRRRWELSREDFHRIGDLSTLLFVALVFYLYLTREMIRAVAAILAWLPVACFPLIAAQYLSAAGRLDLGALFWSMRRRNADAAGGSIDISYPYFTLCLLSAGAANVRTYVYYAGVWLLCAAALWQVRSRSTPAWLWAALVAAAGALGFAGQSGLAGLQLSLENAAVDAVFGRGGSETDPYRSRTALGQIGLLQQSGEIVLRVSAEQRPPALLREASYNRYLGAQWLARDPGFAPLRAAGDGTSWELAPSAPGEESIVVTAVWPRGDGMLALPLGATRVEGLRAGGVGRNRLGAVKATEASAVLGYRVRYGAAPARDAAPAPADLEVPPSEAATFAALARQLGLARLPPRRALDVVARYFSDNFRYTVFQEKASSEPLRDFLLKTRAGHCEYFATATVLLLRAAGIPARYAVGYSVQEYSRLEKAYVLRQRHGHAWALAYVDGAWRDLDTTPASWSDVEQSRGSRLEPLSDLISWARLRAARLRSRWSQSDGRGLTAWLLLLALAGWIFWKASALVKDSRRAAGASAGAPAVRGADSEFFAVEKELARAGLGRRSEEAPAAWLERIADAVGAAEIAPLRALLALHYRHRFDPVGLRPDEREELRRSAESWLAENRRAAAGRTGASNW